LQATRKNNSEGCPSNHVSAAAMTSASDEKWRPFNCFFSRVGLRTYQHPCSASTPKRSRDVLSISEKVKILDTIEIKKKSCAEMARLYGKNESSIREVMKNKGKTKLVFLLRRKLQKLLL